MKELEYATPSTPVEILGLSSAPLDVHNTLLLCRAKQHYSFAVQYNTTPMPRENTQVRFQSSASKK